MVTGGARAAGEPVGADRPRDILEPLLAQALERQPELAVQLVPGRARDHHAADLGEAFEPRGHIDPVAIDVVAFDHDVAEIDSDAQWEAVGIALLDVDRAGDRVDHAPELGQHPVPDQLDQAPAMLRQRRLDHVGAQRCEPGQRAGFVTLDQPRVASNVGRQDGGQSPVRTLRSHLPSPVSAPNEGTLPRRGGIGHGSAAISAPLADGARSSVLPDVIRRPYASDARALWEGPAARR